MLSQEIQDPAVRAAGAEPQSNTAIRTRGRALVLSSVVICSRQLDMSLEFKGEIWDEDRFESHSSTGDLLETRDSESGQ